MYEARTLVGDAIGNTRRMPKNGIIEKLGPRTEPLSRRAREGRCNACLKERWRRVEKLKRVCGAANKRPWLDSGDGSHCDDAWRHK